MSFVFFCRIGTCRPCARGVSGAGLRLLNVRRAKILFSAVIFFLPAAIFRPPSAFPPAPNPLFSVSFAPFDPPAAFLSPFLSSRLFPPAAFLFPVRPLPSRLLPAPPAAFLSPVFLFPSASPATLFPPPLLPSSFPSFLSRPLASQLRSGPVCRLPLFRSVLPVCSARCQPLSRSFLSGLFPAAAFLSSVRPPPPPPRPPSYLSPVLLVPSLRLFPPAVPILKTAPSLAYPDIIPYLVVASF